jgi:hypothetical protein
LNWQLETGNYFSIFSPLLTHSSHPPLIAFTFFNPKAIMSSAARALVASSGQAQ